MPHFDLTLTYCISHITGISFITISLQLKKNTTLEIRDEPTAEKDGHPLLICL